MSCLESFNGYKMIQISKRALPNPFGLHDNHTRVIRFQIAYAKTKPCEQVFTVQEHYLLHVMARIGLSPFVLEWILPANWL